MINRVGKHDDNPFAISRVVAVGPSLKYIVIKIEFKYILRRWTAFSCLMNSEGF